MNILVVEDEIDVGEMIQAALEAMGNSCVIAESADHAEIVLSSDPVDAVTLDLGMPGRTGLDWLESMARARPDLARKTLVITGAALGPDSIERVARCGAGLLSKPFTLETLEEAVRTQLEHDSGTPRATN